MKQLTAADLAAAPARVEEIAAALRSGGVVCLPLGGAYRLCASLGDEAAVLKLLQSKRRSGHRPALVLVTGVKMLEQLTGRCAPAARRLIDRFWPGPLTLLCDVTAELPPKVTRALTRATGKVGVRSPEDPVAAAVVAAYGGPILVSSANLANRPGAGSVAKVRSSFARQIDVLVDAGDLPPAPSSTLVELTAEGFTITREGAISEAEIAAALK